MSSTSNDRRRSHAARILAETGDYDDLAGITAFATFDDLD